MALYHAYTQTVADGTATSVVRPSDWNSGHLQQMTLSGNTSGVSTVSGTNIVFQGGSNVTLSANQGANVATVIISGTPTGGGGATESFFQPEIYGATLTSNHANGTVYFRPFELEGPADIDRFLLQQSMSMSATTMSVSGSISGGSASSGSGSFGQSGTILLFTRSNTVEGNASSATIRSYLSVSTSMSNGLSVSVSWSTNAGSASCSYTTSAALVYLKNIDTTGGVTYSTLASNGSGSFSSSSTAANSFSSSFSATFHHNMLSGIRPHHCPGQSDPIPSGEYWFAVVQSTNTGSTNYALQRPTMATTIGQLYYTASSNNYLEIGNSVAISTSNWRPGFGSLSASSLTTGNIALSQISNMASNASLYFAGIGHGI